MSEDALAEIRGELARILDRLEDLGIAALRDALERGEQGRPEIERRITRARHALERAIGALGGGAGG